MANTYTLSAARSATYSRLRETNSALVDQTNVDAFINEAHMTVLKERHYGFMDSEVVFETSKDTTIAEALTTANTDFDVADSTGLSTAGTLLIKGDVIAYTGNAVNNLTGVTGVNTTHASGANAQQIYDIANDLGVSNFHKTTYLSLNQKEILYYDSRGGVDDEKYTIRNGFLYLPFNAEKRDCIMKYKKSVSKLTADSDVFVIPDDYVGLVVEYALYKSKLDMEYDSANAHFAEFRRMVRRMRKDEANQTETKYKRMQSIYQPGFKRT